MALGKPPDADIAPGSFATVVAKEIERLRPWYEIGLKARRAHTFIGLSRLKLEDLTPFIATFLEPIWPENPRDDVCLADTLKYATEDLKGFFEAAAAQPGPQATSLELDNWFWGATTAGQIFMALRKVLLQSEDDDLKFMVVRTLMPVAQGERKNKFGGQKQTAIHLDGSTGLSLEGSRYAAT